MSASKRGYQNMQVEGFDPNKELPNDYYQTPEKVVVMAYRVLQQIAKYPVQSPIVALDVGAGTGVWGQQLVKFAGDMMYMPPVSAVDGIEIDPQHEQPQGYRHWLRDDLRTVTYTENRYRLVVGNPPYQRTDGKSDRKMVDKAIELGWAALQPQSWMVYLLKTVYAEGEARGSDLFKRYRPNRIMVSSARIPFRPATMGGKTNTVSYALYYWYKDEYGFSPNNHTDFGWFNWKKGEITL